MPRLPRLRIGVLDELAKQLRFAPRETLRRQLERTEHLAAEIDPALNYPEDWLVFRITGYRQEIDAPAVVVGGALLRELSALVERLSAAAGLTERDLNRERVLTLPELRARWRVSAKTVERYRRRGLIARRIAGERGRAYLVFPLAAVERFEAAGRERLDAAAGFTRIDGALRARIVRQAAAYRRRLGWSLNRAAERLARRYSRGHETVRQLLKAHDAKAPRPIFGEPGPPSARERRLIDLAHWRAIEPGEVAKRLGRSSAAVLRITNDERAKRLRTLVARAGALAARGGERKKAAPPRAAAPPERLPLGAPGGGDLLELIATVRDAQPLTLAVERAIAEEYRRLLDGAAAAIRDLPEHGARAQRLDAAETDLRLAARLKAELVRSQVPLVVRTLAATLGRPLEEVRGSVLLPLVMASIAAVGAAVEGFEPGKGGRLAGPAGLAVTRLATRFVREHSAELGRGPGRARAALRLGTGVILPDWTRSVEPWQSWEGRAWLELDAAARRGMGAIAAKPRRVLALRHGIGGRPRTLAETARDLGTTGMAAARMERRAIRESRRAGPEAP
ncbi:MAG: hypothetical protein WD749_14590 [Phycisphaerales bacterium]